MYEKWTFFLQHKNWMECCRHRSMCWLVDEQVICRSCSSHKAALEYLKFRMARVCDSCYVALSGNSLTNIVHFLSQQKIIAIVVLYNSIYDNCTIKEPKFGHNLTLKPTFWHWKTRILTNWSQTINFDKRNQNFDLKNQIFDNFLNQKLEISTWSTKTPNLTVFDL